jgi:hypothetical protein
LCPGSVHSADGVGFIVTNLETDRRAVARFYNKRGTAEQWIEEVKQAVKMTRLSCHLFRSHDVRKFRAIDAHSHTYARTPEEIANCVRAMDEVGVETTVVLSGATGQPFDNQVELFLKAHPEPVPALAWDRHRQYRRAGLPATRRRRVDVLLQERCARRGRNCG